MKIKRTEAAGKQRVESYDSVVPSRPGNYWLNLKERKREGDSCLFFPRALYPQPWISTSLKEKERDGGGGGKRG